MVVCKYLALLFVEVLPKLSFLLFFKAVVSFSISLTSVFYRAADETLGVKCQKKFWMSWRMTQKQISRKTSLAKYNFRKRWGILEK